MTGQIRVNEITDETGTGAPEFPNGIKSSAITDADGTGAPSFPFGAEGIESVPAGALMHFSMDTPPTGWLKANGAAISRTTYSALFDAIGTTFGAGDGSTTFDLPDLRGEFMRSWDDGRGVDSGRSFGTFQDHQFQTHAHSFRGGASIFSRSSGRYQDIVTANVHDGDAPLRTVPSSVVSGNRGAETRPRNIAMLACIKY